MRRLTCGLVAILGLMACEPASPSAPRSSTAVREDAPTSGVRVSGYARVGVSVRN